MSVKNIFKVLIASVLLKIAYLVFAYFVLGNSSIFSFQGYSSIINRNDTGWYGKIAENWYPEITDVRDLGYSYKEDFKQSEWAFFPLYPAINRALMNACSITFDESAFIWSVLLSSLVFIGFYIFCELYTKDPRKSLYYSMVFLLFPFNYYFSMMYTEAAFFVLLIFAFIAVHQRKNLYLPFLIIPLVLVRSAGIVALIPLYLYFLERNHILTKYRLDVKQLLGKRNIGQTMLFVTGPIAFLLYCLYQKQMTGQFFAFSIAQAGWYREFRFPLLSFFRSGDFTTQFNSVYTLIVMILSIFIWKKNPLSLNLFIWLSLLLPLCSGLVTSMPRFISVIFPLVMILGSWLYRFKYRNLFLGIFFSLQIFVFYYWLIAHPFSF